MESTNRSIHDLLAFVEREGATLCPPILMGDLPPMEYSCEVIWNTSGKPLPDLKRYDLPPSLEEFWRLAHSARLFVDTTYGQWGLELLGFDDAAAQSKALRKSIPKNMRHGDLVVGRFLGDSELVIVRCDKEATDWGELLVQLPIDAREDWYRPANSFHEFLNCYVDARGEKYWTKSD